ncbi:hypothetical protein CCHR01_16944 [Colletotrichum chrysophilum]|uniref:Uncharacterized protein n=1 Tax=Colletotrichum chrysophilum TaxID=1836956 RepID=A0AAD9A301_9PEZI|nr:hypothetical protein CCHR01_16944 [Colletotrichum chrysophilum]
MIASQGLDDSLFQPSGWKRKAGIVPAARTTSPETQERVLFTAAFPSVLSNAVLGARKATTLQTGIGSTGTSIGAPTATANKILFQSLKPSWGTGEAGLRAGEMWLGALSRQRTAEDTDGAEPARVAAAVHFRDTGAERSGTGAAKGTWRVEDGIARFGRGLGVRTKQPFCANRRIFPNPSAVVQRRIPRVSFVSGAPTLPSKVLGLGRGMTVDAQQLARIRRRSTARLASEDSVRDSVQGLDRGWKVTESSGDSTANGTGSGLTVEEISRQLVEDHGCGHLIVRSGCTTEMAAADGRQSIVESVIERGNGEMGVVSMVSEPGVQHVEV